MKLFWDLNIKDKYQISLYVYELNMNDYKGSNLIIDNIKISEILNGKKIIGRKLNEASIQIETINFQRDDTFLLFYEGKIKKINFSIV
jgi:hypothetical protein